MIAAQWYNTAVQHNVAAHKVDIQNETTVNGALLVTWVGSAVQLTDTIQGGGTAGKALVLINVVAVCQAWLVVDSLWSVKPPQYVASHLA